MSHKLAHHLPLCRATKKHPFFRRTRHASGRTGPKVGRRLSRTDRRVISNLANVSKRVFNSHCSTRSYPDPDDLHADRRSNRQRNGTLLRAGGQRGIVSLQFKIDGQNFGPAITAGSCRASWDSAQTGDGLHTIQAVGLDEFGNTTLSQPVTVLVSNYAMPSPPAPEPSPTPGPSPTPTPAPTPTPSPSPEPALRITYPVAGSTVSEIFDTAVVFAAEIAPSSVRLEIRQPPGQLALTWPAPAHGRSNLLVFRPVLRTLDNGPI